MSTRNAGSAFIKVKPDATDFARDLRRDLRAVRDPGFVIDVRADTSQAAVDVRRFRDVEQRNGIKMGVDVALGQAQADLAAFRARQRADGMTIKVDADTGQARSQVNSFRRQIEGIGRSDAFRINLTMAGVSLLPTAALGLTQVAQAIQQVSQAGLALPGALGSATASIGTLLVGLSGIADAWKAADAAADSAGVDQAAQARAAAAATTGLRNAVVDEVQARRDQAQAYRDARNQLEDLNVQMRGGLISESRAILEAQKAREDLARGNFSDIRDARLRVVEADQRVLEVQTRNKQTADKLQDSNKKGIEQSDLVVAANERVVRAQQQTADAHLAVSDAASKQSAAQRKAADELAKLSPKAREFFEALRGLKPVASDLKNTVQDIGFDGLTARLESTAQKMMPTLKSGMSTIAHGWNENFQQLFTSIGSDEGKTIIDRILGSTGDAQSKLTAAIDPLIKGVGTLTAAGSEAMPRVADAIADVAGRFQGFITQADKDGRLEKWINDGITGIGHLGETVLNLGKTWTAITKAAGGGALLGDLEMLTGRMQRFLNSTEGQDKLRKFFDEGRAMLDQWRPILEAIPGLFQGIYDGAKIHIGGVLTILGPLVKLLSDHPTLVSTAIAAWAGWKTIGPVMSAVQGTLGGLSTAVANLSTGFYTTRDNAKKAMKDVDDVFVKAGKPTGSGLSKFSGALSALGAAGGPMMALGSVAIPALIGAMQLLDTQNQKSAEKTDYLNSRQKNLEETLDRVTGKLTRQTREAQISAAQNYDPGGRGGGAPGISKGDALAAATRLGIAPDVYGDALVGDQGARQRVMDVLKNNNLVPEFQQNTALQATAKGINEITQGQISQDDLINALLNAPGAVGKYDEALNGARQRANGDQDTLRRIDEFYSLLSIAQRLSATGQAAVLSGGALNTLASTLPSGDTTRQANQANYGRWRLTPNGTGFFGGDFQVNSDGANAKVVIPGTALPGMRGKLDQAGLTGTPNADGTVTIQVPLNSPYIEQYATGGPVDSTPGPFAGGGKLAVVHPDEFVVSKRGRATVPDSFLHQLNTGRVGHFWGGGQAVVDQDGNPIEPGSAPGPAAPTPVAPVAPVAPNPTGGGVQGVISSVISGIQGPIGNALSLGNSLINMSQAPGGGEPVTGQTIATRAASVPGLIGLFGSMAINDPDLQKAALTSWGQQTANWTANWAVGNLTKGASILYQGALGAVGLDQSILSPSNEWNQAISRAGEFAMGADSPITKLMGVSKDGTSSSAGLTDPSALASQYGVTIDPATGQMLTSPMAADATLSPEVLQSLFATNPSAALASPINGESARDYAHRVMMPFWQSRGFTVGDHGADKYGEHQNGAIDIMVPNIEAGQRVLQQVLSEPNVYGVIFNNQVYGYGQGFTPRDYTSGHTGNPTQDHQDHVHVWYKPQGKASGGPIAGPGGPKSDLIPTMLSNGEFVQQVSAVDKYGLPFMHRLNAGLIDPSAVRRLAAGGPIQQGVVQPNPNVAVPTPPAPKPNFNPGAGAIFKQLPQAIVPAQPRPTPAAPPPPAPVPTQAPAPAQTPVATPTMVAPTAAPPNSLNHNLPALSKGISSAASTLGTWISTAMSLAAAGASAGGSAVAGPAMGAASSFAAGLATQGGKIVEDAANVVSSFLVGNVPGSNGDPNGPAYGTILRPEQDRPSTASYRRGGDTNNFFGYEARDVIQQKENHDALKRQSRLGFAAV